MSQILQDVNEVIREVFADDEITLSETSTAEDIDGWDSLMHLNVIIAMEKRFGVRFSTAEISDLKEEGRNIGTLVDLIRSKKGTSN